MKKILMTMVLGALMACLVPSLAQNTQEWKSTSTMQGTGSSLSPQVTAVGAANVSDMATTTSTSSAAKASSGPHRSIEYLDEMDGDEGSPIGDALLPLMLCALAFGGYVAIRKKRANA